MNCDQRALTVPHGGFTFNSNSNSLMMSYSLAQNLQGTREGGWEAESLERSHDCPDWPGAPGPTVQPPSLLHLEITGSSGTSPVVQWLILTLPLQGTQVGSSVGKLRSHMPCGTAKKIFKNKIKN